jgi:PAS domain S-box-containing protein
VLCVGTAVEATADRLGQNCAEFSVRSEPTVQDALAQLSAGSQIDCVVSSYQLPEQDGLTLLRRVRESHGELPFVLLASEGSEAVAADAINAKANGYFRTGAGGTALYRRVCDRIESAVEAYHTRQAQLETRERLIQLAESSRTAVWLFSADWEELIYVNSTYEDIFGRSIATLEADPTDFMQGVHPDDREMVQNAMQTLSDGEQIELEYRVNPKEEYQRWVQVEGEPVYDDSGTLVYAAGFARDVTDQKERQRKLQEKTRQLQSILATVEASIFMADRDGRYVLANERARELFGIGEEDLNGKLIEEVHDDEAARTIREDFEQVLEAGEMIEFEREIPTQQGTRTFLSRLSPIYSEAGEIQGVTGFRTDITERNQRQEQLERQNQEMEVFNSLLRHDILNGITVIRTRGDMLAEELEGEHQQYAETIIKWSDNMTGLVQRIRDVLTTLTGDVPELERVNLSKGLHEQVETVETSYQAVAFETTVPDGVFVQANELLTDVFKNVLMNAVEHNEREGLCIESTVTVEDETVTVRIADNGRGVPDELKEAIFRRGRTGHVKQTGSGFGLFFVDAMVTAYGGEVSVEDNDAGGATFTVELPTSD